MFTHIESQTKQKLKEMIDGGGTLFRVEPDRDKVWEVYLSNFSEATRQEHNCNCCKSFLRQYAGIVGIKNGKRITLWDFDAEDEDYTESIKALKKYIHSLPIAGIFLNPDAICGTAKNRDMKREIYWNHFNLTLPSNFVKRDIGPAQAAALDNKNVLQRSLTEITDDAVNTVLELIGQNSLYRGQEFKGMVTEFSKIKEKHKKLKPFERENFYWGESVKATPAVTRIRNSSIGTLLNDLSEGKDLDKAVTAFERVVAPTNYKRPTALATPKMIDAAKKRLEELGMLGSLKRRILSTRDLDVNSSIFVHRVGKKSKDIFEELKTEAVINPKSFSKLEEISIKDFITNVIPTAKSLRVLLENSHFGNFVSLVGPQTPGEIPLMKWDNDFSWSYTGGVASSIKERVKAAGGKVDGVLRISLSWENTDDLDLRLVEPNGKYTVYYGNRRVLSPSGATLDLDANGADGIKENPVENIYWTQLPKIGGDYKVVVNQFSKRQSQNQGFEVEIEIEGEIYSFSCPTNGLTGHNHNILTFNYTKSTGFKIISGSPGESKFNSKEKWGLKTGQFHRVKALTLSPNYWNKEIGNKHFFFFLENCVADEPIRGFYNEQLRQDLDKDRKVFELLGSKIEVEPSSDELSGVGFCDTERNNIVVEIESAFKRLLKIKF